MNETRFICFASYKGGVGRSLALANTAYLLAREGRKVLIIDFDLEAPGQHLTDLFKKNTREGHGLLELIEDFRNEFSGDQEDQPYPWQLSRFIQRSVAFDNLMMALPSQEKASTGEGGEKKPGQLWLMRAGALDDEYYKNLHELSWADFYEQDCGGLFFEALKAKLRLEDFDDVLIDARTGLSDVFMISTLTLADTVVVVTGIQDQHVEGLERVISLLRDPANEKIYGRKKIFVVLSPVAELSVDERRRREDEIRQRWSSFPGFDVDIPYFGPLFLREQVMAFRRDEQGVGGSADSIYVSRMADLKEMLESKEGGQFVENLRPSNPFAVIRTDYTGPEEWSQYFVDPGERIIDGMRNFMPCIVTGARGSGKTMLARQFSYETLVQKLRREGRAPEPQNVPYIGLYFRIDQDILRIFDTKDEKLRPIFDRLFSQYVDIIILRKALTALNALGGIRMWFSGRHEALFNILFREMGITHSSIVLDLDTMLEVLEQRISEIRVYTNNPSTVQPPFAVQPNVLMKLLVEQLWKSKTIGKTYFLIMIDEYENYREYQQKTLNTRLKQAKQSDGSTYKFLARNEGIRVFETLAVGQPIQSPHDYRKYSLDEEFNFTMFQSYLMKISNRHLGINNYFTRRGASDISKLLSALSPEEEAEKIARKRGADELLEWVRKHQSSAADLLKAWFDEESSVLRRATATVVINQGKDPQTVIDAFRTWDNRARNWYHNYHRGALFWLGRLYRTHKTYAGFSDVVGLSGENVRTGLEFCFSIIEDWIADGAGDLPISVDLQTQAIRAKSEEYRKLIRSTDVAFADQMLTFADRIGRLFEAIHRSPRQSEPEVNHFHIAGDPSDTVRDFLNRCYMEEVLRRIPERKQKDMATEKRDSWQLHPRLAPCYGISWRSKKNIVLKVEDLEMLCFGSNEEWKSFQNRSVSLMERLGGQESAQSALDL